MNANPPVVVVVEDEKQIRRFVRTALEAEGLSIFEAGTCKQGLIEVATRKPDLVILDLGLPDGDGLDFIRDLRGWSDLPIIVLSARSQEADKISALDQGADDYLIKPFGVGELLARIRAALRRRATVSGTTGESLFNFGDVQVDQLNRVVRRAGQSVHLTPIEYRLLTTLIRNGDKVLTHRQLLREVWGPSHVDRSHYLRIYMGHLRQKLEVDPARPRHILTETGIGYRFHI